MRHATEKLDELKVASEKRVVSAHRTPDLLFEYCESAESRGLKVIIAGRGWGVHLPGMAAAKTVLPVLGVPVERACYAAWIRSSPLSKCPRAFQLARWPSDKPGRSTQRSLRRRF